MPTSGTVTYSVTELDVITNALEDIGAIGAGETPSPEDISTARRKLNLIIKQWVSQIDFAPGLKMWTRRRAYLFPQKGQSSYSLGPSGDHATESYVETTLSAGASTSDGTVSLTSASGISSGDYIGVVLDTGSVHWTTVNGAPAGNVATLTNAMPSASSSGSRVWAYTTKMRRPFEIATAVRRDRNGDDSPIDSKLILQDYEAIPDKDVAGAFSRMYLEAQRTNAVVYMDCAPDVVIDNVVRMVYLSYIEDTTATTQEVEFPAEWFRPLSAQLSMDCCPAFGVSASKELIAMHSEAMAFAKRAYPETSTAEYQNNPDCY